MFENKPNRFLVIEETQRVVGHVVDQVSKAVTATMGPNGSLSLIETSGSSVQATKDGVTVARSIKFEDPHEEIVSRVLIEPAVKTDDECGDGTTTTIFLTALLYKLFRQHPSYIEQRFITGIFEKVIKRLEESAISITTKDPLIYNLALTSSNNDHGLSKAVTEIYNDSGDKFPFIELKESIGVEDVVERSEGILVQMGFSNPSFSRNGRGEETHYKDFVSFVIDGNLEFSATTHHSVMKSLIDLVEKFPQTILICRTASHDFNSLVFNINNASKKGKLIVVQTNAGGSVGSLLMGDIATMFNTKLLVNFDQVDTTPVTTVSETLVVGSGKSIFSDLTDETRARINDRIEDIRKDVTSKEAKDKHSLRGRFNEKRIRMLSGELVTVYVGGQTNSEIKERKDRFEDVIKAVKSALVNGILPGVGTALFVAVDSVVREHLNFLGSDVTPEIQKMLGGIHRISQAQFVKLADHPLLTQVDIFRDPVTLDELKVTNLATGQTGTAKELGIYDTAYASITALRGGLQTAKILANLESLIIGGKGVAVKA